MVLGLDGTDSVDGLKKAEGIMNYNNFSSSKTL